MVPGFHVVTEASGVLVIGGNEAEDDQEPRTRMLGHRSSTTGSGSTARELFERTVSLEVPEQWSPTGGVVVHASSRRQSRKTNPPSTRRIVPVT